MFINTNNLPNYNSGFLKELVSQCVLTDGVDIEINSLIIEFKSKYSFQNIKICDIDLIHTLIPNKTIACNNYFTVLLDLNKQYNNLRLQSDNCISFYGAAYNASDLDIPLPTVCNSTIMSAYLNFYNCFVSNSAIQSGVLMIQSYNLELLQTCNLKIDDLHIKITEHDQLMPIVELVKQLNLNNEVEILLLTNQYTLEGFMLVPDKKYGYKVNQRLLPIDDDNNTICQTLWNNLPEEYRLE